MTPATHHPRNLPLHGAPLWLPRLDGVALRCAAVEFGASIGRRA
ncbi:MAG TPA: hypothetical protein VMH92_13875 [Acidocella sp.]|nr:hypothetical protein [Acidocella sp.]